VCARHHEREVIKLKNGVFFFRKGLAPFLEFSTSTRQLSVARTDSAEPNSEPLALRLFISYSNLLH